MSPSRIRGSLTVNGRVRIEEGDSVILFTDDPVPPETLEVLRELFKHFGAENVIVIHGGRGLCVVEGRMDYTPVGEPPPPPPDPPGYITPLVGTDAKKK